MRRLRTRKRGIDPDTPGSRRVSSSRRNTAAIEATIAELRRAGRRKAIDAALVAAATTTAEALDAADTPYAAAMVVRVHLEA